MAKAKAKPPEDVKAAMDSHDLETRQAVAEDAYARQIDNKPAQSKRTFRVTASVGNENRAMQFAAQDESDAWAQFCDAAKLPEGMRSRKIVRPVITEIGAVPAVPTE